jgi:Secretion system C-terminal sorting domain
MWKMKRLFTILLGLVLFSTAEKAYSQAFTVAQDTVWFAQPTVLTTIHDNLTVTGSSPLTIKWQIDTANSDFPYDWMYNASGGTSFCDNAGCYSSSIDTAGTMITSSYSSSATDFHMNIDLASATTTSGSYHMTVKFSTFGVIPPTTATETFISYPPTMVPMVKSADEVMVYPNPATTSVNVVYDGGLDIRNVAIYNIIGKMMSIYKVSGNSANLNTENLSSGIYFIRLINSHGDVVQTRKFTRQ